MGSDATGRTASATRRRRAARRVAGIAVLTMGGLLLASCAAAEPPGDEDRAGPQDEPAANQQEETPVHPAFSFTEREVHALVAGEPVPVRDAVTAEPRAFLELVDAVLREPASLTVLVDKSTALDESYVPADLVDLDTVDGLTLSRAGHRLTRPATEALVEMTAGAARDGVTLVVGSTYRSYDYQADLFARWVDELGREEAERVSARPGTSQHQLGTTIDFGCICDGFADEPAGVWLAANAGRFGFSLSYPEGYESVTGYSYEPWHFRYVGRAATELERRFFDGVQQWMLEFLNDRREALEAARDDD